MVEQSASVVIPTLNAGNTFPELLRLLRSQTLSPREIIVVDSGSVDGTVETAKRFGCLVETISPEEFTHGRARNLGVRSATAEIVVFVTQDVTPVGDEFVERLTRPLREGVSAASYGRQIARPMARESERFLRLYNYPAFSSIRAWPACSSLGIRAFMMSNAASAIRVSALWEAGGFPDRILTNEDMLLCARLLKSGSVVTYVAEAEVLHSHQYNIRTTFRRYFDIGAFMAEYRAELGTGADTSDGREYVTQMLRHLGAVRALHEVPFALAETIAKFCGYRIGLLCEYLPGPVARTLSRHPAYWIRV